MSLRWIIFEQFQKGTTVVPSVVLPLRRIYAQRPKMALLQKIVVQKTEKDDHELPALSMIPALYFGWIPGVRIVITFSMGKFWLFQYWKWFNGSRRIWGYISSIPWEFRFENITQSLKLRGLRPYTFVVLIFEIRAPNLGVLIWFHIKPRNFNPP